MRCLHCGKRLSLLKKLQDTEFCSEEHRGAYQQQQTNLALSRLLDSQRKLDKPASRGSSAASPSPKKAASNGPRLRKLKEEEPPLAGFVPPNWQERAVEARRHLLCVAHLFTWDTGVLLPEQVEKISFARGKSRQIGWAPRTTPWRAEVRMCGRPRPRLLVKAPRLRVRPEWDVRCTGGLVRLGTRAAEVPSRLRPSSLPWAVSLDPGAWPQLQEIPLAMLEIAWPDMPEPVPAPVEETEPAWAVLQTPTVPAVQDSLRARRLHWASHRAHKIRTPQEPAWPRVASSRPDRALRGDDRLMLVSWPAAQRAIRQVAQVAPPLTAVVHLDPAPRLAGAGPAGVNWGWSRRMQAIGTTASRASHRTAAAPPPPLQTASPAETPHLTFRQTAGMPEVQLQHLPVPAILAGGTIAFGTAQWELKKESSRPLSPMLPQAQPLTGAVQYQPAADGAQLPLPLPGICQPEAPAAGIALTTRGVPTAASWTVVSPLAPQADLRPLPPDHPQPTVEEEEEPPPPLHTRILPSPLQRPVVCRTGLHSGPVRAPQAVAAEPIVPQARLDPDRVHESRSLPGFARQNILAQVGRLSGSLPGTGFWRHAPSDLKMLGIGLPLVVVLVVYSVMPSYAPVPEVREPVVSEVVSLPPAVESPEPVPVTPASLPRARSTSTSRVSAFQQAIQARAAIDYLDDFRSGLGAWTGSGDWARTWKYDKAQFVEPGQLALYSPTLPLADYSLEFLGQIGRRSLSWVFRAKDLKNYYVMRLVLTKNGALTQGSITRYAVVDGRKGPEKTLPLPMPIHQDALLRVRTEVRGHTFTTWMQEQVVDNFSDDRIERGGVGFFTVPGDRALLRWVEVKHQYDFLGRLCAMLAPYSVQADGRTTE